MEPYAIQSWPDLGSRFFKLSGSAWALVPLEAWRRGLEVTLRPGAKYDISDGQHDVAFWQTRVFGPEQSTVVAVCNDKELTKRFLERSGVSVPAGRYFTAPFDKSAIRRAAQEMGFPVCIKPNALAKARGVFPGIKDDATLSRLLDHVIDELQTPDLLLEENVSGDMVRVVVAGDKVVAATLAVPANVVGDGSSNISELIKLKNAERKGNPHLGLADVQIDKEGELRLEEQGLTLESVPARGQRVFLSETANVAAGSDSIEVTETISQTVHDQAVAAVRAIPGLHHAGIDVLVEDYRDPAARTAICEVNPSCGLGGHVYPGVGKRRDVPSAFVDYHFPDSARLPGAEHWHFALSSIERLFRSDVASSVTLAPMPVIDDQVWRTLTVSFSGTPVAAKNQVLRQVAPTGAHGTVRAMSQSELEVSLTGTPVAVNRAQRRLADAASITEARIRSRSAFVCSPGFFIV